MLYTTGLKCIPYVLFFFTLIECEILHAEDLQKTMCIFCCVLPQIAISQTQDVFFLL